MKKDINILTTLNLSEESRERISKVSDQVDLTVVPANKPDQVPDELWESADVLYTQGVLPDPTKAPHLRWVQLNMAGVDEFLDHPLLQKEEVSVTSMSGAISTQIAEYVLMALLAFGQKLPKLTRLKRDKKWPSNDDKWKTLLPTELRHSTVGIVGYGSIGRQVARLLRTFGAKILAAKRDVKHPNDSGYMRDGLGDPHGDYFDRLYPIEALHSLLKACDFVVLTLPLTDETHHLLNKEAFEAMKDRAYLVNVGRGGLIDQEALVHALENKQIAGAALDVFEKEPLPQDSPLWEMENVILSPHISGLSKHLEEDTVALFIENLNRYLAELPLYNQLKKEKGY